MVTATHSPERPSTMSSPLAPTHRRLASTALALLLVVVAAGCGASGASDEAGSTTTSGASSTTGGPNTTDEPDTTDTPNTIETEQTSTTAKKGSTGSATKQDYIDALVSSFDPEEDGEEFTEAQVKCLATGWVGIIGVEGFERAGVSPEDVTGDDKDLDDVDISRPEALLMVDVYGDCGLDLKALIVKSLGDTMTPTQKACVDRVLTEENIRTSLVNDLIGDDAADEDDPLADLSDCVMG